MIKKFSLLKDWLSKFLILRKIEFWFSWSSSRYMSRTFSWSISLLLVCLASGPSTYLFSSWYSFGLPSGESRSRSSRSANPSPLSCLVSTITERFSLFFLMGSSFFDSMISSLSHSEKEDTLELLLRSSSVSGRVSSKYRDWFFRALLSLRIYDCMKGSVLFKPVAAKRLHISICFTFERDC